MSCHTPIPTGSAESLEALTAAIAHHHLTGFFNALEHKTGAPGPALYDLGRCFQQGVGVPASPEWAERCFRAAAALGPNAVASSFRAPLRLGMLLARNQHPDAESWLLYGLAAHARYEATRLPGTNPDAYEQALSQAASAWPAWLPEAPRQALIDLAWHGHTGARALVAADLAAFQRPAGSPEAGWLRLTLLLELAKPLVARDHASGLAPMLGGAGDGPGDAPALGGRR